MFCHRLIIIYIYFFFRTNLQLFCKGHEYWITYSENYMLLVNPLILLFYKLPILLISSRKWGILLIISFCLYSWHNCMASLSSFGGIVWSITHLQHGLQNAYTGRIYGPYFDNNALWVASNHRSCDQRICFWVTSYLYSICEKRKNFFFLQICTIRIRYRERTS